jgi:hypothetical protein
MNIAVGVASRFGFGQHHADFNPENMEVYLKVGARRIPA